MDSEAVIHRETVGAIKGKSNMKQTLSLSSSVTMVREFTVSGVHEA